ncbi:MAG: CRISPR-associated endonuclease Cas3'', partial [Oscillospiraceae bacterium]|nr:CRISPR-associated endonuclease Cas3'' [Oscillospiraceae bacterium]
MDKFGVYIAHRTKDGREQTLLEHLKKVSEKAGEFAEEFGCRELAAAVGLCHDVGKFSKKFQRRIRGENVHVDHATAGGQLLYTTNRNCLGLLAAYCVMGHHGGLPDSGNSQSNTDNPELFGRLKREVEDYFAYKSEITTPLLTAPGFTPRDGFGAAFLTRMLFSALVDADWLDTEQFMTREVLRVGILDVPALKTRLFGKISELITPPDDVSELNARRSGLLNDCVNAATCNPGLFKLTAPTGSGKTIASLAFALAHAQKHGKRHVIYVIPLNTVIEQNATVFEDLVGAENVLQHHSNINYDGDENERKRFSTENWDYPLIVTSSVRFFESLFANKPSDCRKLHNIANSVIIFDE